ncbi:MAG: hypothetical protein Q7K40_03185 [bacterium]|nr:hypothetical protein [bacterium]
MAEKIKSKTAVEEIIEKSGNSFHSRVVNKLRDEGWSVLVSPHYNDNFTDKPREIDIIAEKKFNVTEVFGEWLGTVNVLLFIECKYVNNETVFWFEKKDIARATERIMHNTGLDDPRRNTGIQKHHHYADVPIAKLFASDKGRSEDNEVINKAINQVLNATVYYRNRGDLKLATTERGYIERVIKRVSYPLIVVNSFDSFHATEMNGSGEAKPITEAFPLEVNYAYTDKDRNGHNEYFLIDVVSLDKLPEFLTSTIEKLDVATISEKLRCDKRTQPQPQRNRGFDSSM